jgi:7-hydroxymethyl chlorophyll a reductase
MFAVADARTAGATTSTTSSSVGASRRRRSSTIARATVDAKPIAPGSAYPAKEHCSRCGLCDTKHVAHVKDACAFLGESAARFTASEITTHGRARALDGDEARLGVVDDVFYATMNAPVPGAQWTGIVTSVAREMLRSGKVDGVICVGSAADDSRAPEPVLATTDEEILATRGVKPSLSPNLKVLAEVEARGIRKLLFIGVGCSVSALRAVEPYLGLEKLYVVGTNCTDNGPREGFNKFVNAASEDPDTVMHYEFMQDYQVHLKHTDGSYEKVPYFCLPANDLVDVIAPSCYSCFDYVNGLADLVVGYMGVPYMDKPMDKHPQYVTVRNARGQEMVDMISDKLTRTPSTSSGDHRQFVMQTVIADDEAKLGRGPEKPAPRFVGKAIAWILTKIGPKGKSFGFYSLDYHVIRNYIYVNRVWGSKRASEHVPEYAKQIVKEYDVDGAVSARLKLRLPNKSR